MDDFIVQVMYVHMYTHGSIFSAAHILGIIWYARIVGTLGMAVDRVHLIL